MMIVLFTWVLFEIQDTIEAAQGGFVAGILSALAELQEFVTNGVLTGAFFSLKLAMVIENTGNDRISWREQHKLSSIIFMFQSGFICGSFVAYFPWCLYGYPDWTCVTNSTLTLTIVMFLFMIPALPQLPWAYTMVKKLLRASSRPDPDAKQELF